MNILNLNHTRKDTHATSKKPVLIVLRPVPFQFILLSPAASNSGKHNVVVSQPSFHTVVSGTLVRCIPA